MRKTINIIGCGHVGKTLGRLWAAHDIFDIQDILNRSPESAQQAIAFMNAGRAINSLDAMRPADIHLIGVPDDRIAQCAEALAACGKLRPGDIVFHCSGALSSNVLLPAAKCGASVASVHPIRSFANAEQAANSFTGTYCGVEGDQAALDMLGSGFSRIGAQMVPIRAEYKSIYHAAAVFASNYLVTLLDTAVAAYEKAGISREVALKLMEPLVRGTVDNVCRLGTTEALTGPIARGDISTVVRQYRAVKSWDKRRGALYKQLGKLTAEIAQRKNAAKREKRKK